MRRPLIANHHACGQSGDDRAALHDVVFAIEQFVRPHGTWIAAVSRWYGNADGDASEIFARFLEEFGLDVDNGRRPWRFVAQDEGVNLNVVGGSPRGVMAEWLDWAGGVTSGH
jgi:hypothetical protein